MHSVERGRSAWTNAVVPVALAWALLVGVACGPDTAERGVAPPGEHRVACERTPECGTGEICRDGWCRVACRTSQDCAAHEPVCNEELGYCASCEVDEDCEATESCFEGDCEFVCRIDVDCGERAYCDAALGRCEARDCATNADCAAGATCERTGCAPGDPTRPDVGGDVDDERVCVPGSSGCVGDVRWACDATGQVRTETDCVASSRLCESGACVARACAPGATRCAEDGRSVMRCDERGAREQATACEAGERCEAAACVEQAPEGAPTGVTASQGTSDAHVEVTWNPLDGATGYHVYRDGERVTSSPVSGTTYIDEGAWPGGVPAAVTDVSATTDRTEDVSLTWAAATAPGGATSWYTVSAVIDGREGPESASATGFRAGRPVTEYEVRAGAESWQSVGGALAWTDVDAPAGRLTIGTPTATTSRTDGVRLAVAPAGTAEGGTRDYRVRAVNAAGTGPASAVVSGARSVGSPGYQWQRSETSEGGFTTLVGATSRTALDVGLEPGATRWYRVVVSAPGATSVISAAVQGGVGRLGVPCVSDAACATGEWCPSDTSERRCAPRPVIQGSAMPFQWVPRGTFVMGSPEEEVGRASDEDPVSVTLTRDVFVQRTEVTQAQWAAVMAAWNALPDDERAMSGWAGATPAFGTTPSCLRSASGTSCTASGSHPNGPVERVSWWDAVVFANALSRLEGLDPCYALTGCDTGTGAEGVGGGCGDESPLCAEGVFACGSVTFEGPQCTGYRLPTEAEWEHAARAGTATATYNGDLNDLDCAGSIGVLGPIAWYACNSGGRAQPVESKLPNAWGLYDMLGNVREWTSTWYEPTRSGGTDPLGPFEGSSRVIRGGSWNFIAPVVRAGLRLTNAPDRRDSYLGFRLVRTAPE